MTQPATPDCNNTSPSPSSAGAHTDIAATHQMAGSAITPTTARKAAHTTLQHPRSNADPAMA
jgi:V8-like Glu-specific endopeptidase